MKSFILLLTVVGLVSASDFTAFLKGRSCSWQGQDSLACFYYGEALQKDTSSITLKELYAESLQKVGKKDSAIAFFSEVAAYYEKSQEWSKALEVYVILCHKSSPDYYYYGNKASLMGYYVGMLTGNLAKIENSNKLWDIFMEEAVKENKIEAVKLIKDTRIEAAKKVEILKTSKKPPKTQYCWNIA